MITALDNNTALILIDLQNSNVPLPVSQQVQNVLDNVNQLTAAFRKKGLPIIITNVIPGDAAWTKSRKEAKMPSLPDNNDWYQITDKINIAADDIRLTKHTWNAFFETALNDELKKRSVTGIVLAGIATSIGVEGTARAASELGYNITFATDAMTDTQEAAHQRSVQYIFPNIGETGNAEEIVEMISKRS